MFRLFKRKHRSAAFASDYALPAAGRSASFGLFGVYVRSLPAVGR